jgi:hypothetical protein
MISIHRDQEDCGDGLPTRDDSSFVTIDAQTHRVSQIGASAARSAASNFKDDARV